jgi:hypothetical protein
MKSPFLNIYRARCTQQGELDRKCDEKAWEEELKCSGQFADGSGSSSSSSSEKSGGEELPEDATCTERAQAEREKCVKKEEEKRMKCKVGCSLLLTL